jgi:dTDP-4-dehydrorhamnose reductase
MAEILITGANGQLGSELRDISKQYYGYDFTFTDIEALDISKAPVTREFITNLQPDWIVNCAAYNLVDKAESDSESAMLINGTAVKNIAEAISGSDCKFIHVSSDYVYAGISNVPYNEESPADPQSAYGKSKLAGEKYALLHPRSMVIRTSWLYSAYGQNFVKTMLRNGAVKESLRVVFDQTGSPTYAGDLADAIMKIISGVIRNQFAFKAGVYNYSNEGACTWFDFATEIIKEAGLSCQVIPVLSKDFQQIAKRPSYSVMDKSKIKENYNIYIPHWRTSLIKCLKNIK